jgi:hypothetical protein
MKFLEVKEDSDELTTQQRRFSCYHPDVPEEASERSLEFEEVSEHLSRHQPQGTHVRTDVWTAQQTPTPESTYSHRCPNNKLKDANSEDSMQPSGR